MFEARSKKQEARSKKLITSLMLGTALMGAGLTAGLVNNSTSQSVVAQAKTKSKKVTVKNIYYKDGKGHSLSFRVKYGTTVKIPTPKFKGYADIWDGGGEYSLDKNGKQGPSGWTPYVFMKKTTASQQKKNAKSKKAVTATGDIDYSMDDKQPKITFKVKGLSGTLVKTSAPKVNGYTRSATTMTVAILPKNFTDLSYYQALPINISYTKNSSFGYKATKVKATKSKKNGKLKVKGSFAIKNKQSAKKHAATYAVITDYKGTTHVKLNRKKAFNKTIKKRAGAKKVTVMAAYRTKKHNSKSYTYHMLSVPKKVTVKATK